jgi:hypothetical protein
VVVAEDLGAQLIDPRCPRCDGKSAQHHRADAFALLAVRDSECRFSSLAIVSVSVIAGDGDAFTGVWCGDDPREMVDVVEG